MKRVFVSHRGQGAAPYAAWLHRDLAEHLGGDRVVTEATPEPGDIVLVVMTDGGSAPFATVGGISRELPARELDAAILRDDPVIALRVVVQRTEQDRLPSPADTPTTWYLFVREVSSPDRDSPGTESAWDWSRQVGDVADKLTRLLNETGGFRTSIPRSERPGEPAREVRILDRLLSAEAAGAVARTRRSGSAESELRGHPRAAQAEAGVVQNVAEAPTSSVPPAPASPPPPASRASPGRRGRGGLLSRPRLVYGAIAVASLGGAAAFIVRWLLGGIVEPSPSEFDDVDVTVFSPTQAAPGDSILIQVFAHLPAQSRDVRALAAEFDTDTRPRGFASLALPVRPGSTLGFELRVPGLQVDEQWQTTVWRRRPVSVQFGVAVPADALSGTRIATVIVSHDSVPVGHIKFKLTIAAQPPQLARTVSPAAPVGDDALPYQHAFISYAREDWAEVLRRVQVLRLKRLTHLSCFQDVLDEDPGARWERRLYREIDRCDVLLLFWSTAAHDSEWVRREVQYALARKVTEFDRPEILPVVIEVPPCPPWPELAHQHFDDIVARLIATEN